MVGDELVNTDEDVYWNTMDMKWSKNLWDLVNDIDYHIVTNGVNIIVYDEELDQLIDAAGDDIYLGLEMSRKEE